MSKLNNWACHFPHNESVCWIMHFAYVQRGQRLALSGRG